MAITDGALRRPARPFPLLLVLGVASIMVAGLELSGLTEGPGAQTFVLIFVSIVVEALPFVLLGALVGALIEVFVPDRTFAGIARLPLPLQLPGAALGGLAFPVCECGSIPVARRLIARGLHPSAGIAFMLAAPVLNPVVLTSTAIAYRGRGIGFEMVAGRAGLGLVVAIVAGWALGGEKASDLLRPRRDEPEAGPRTPARSRHASVAGHLTADFIYMGRFVVVGAALAALLQTAIPQSLVAGIATTPVAGSLALMAIAFVLSLCSEADAFVAVSFTPFPVGSQLAFLVFGPVVDAKLALLYGATFRRRFVARLAVVVIPLVLAGSLWFEAILA